MMSRQQFIDLWPSDYLHFVVEGPNPLVAKTRKNALHKVNPVFQPGRTKYTPAQYRRLHLGRKK